MIVSGRLGERDSSCRESPLRSCGIVLWVPSAQPLEDSGGFRRGGTLGLRLILVKPEAGQVERLPGLSARAERKRFAPARKAAIWSGSEGRTRTGPGGVEGKRRAYRFTPTTAA